jgi:hypothetical protein
MATKTFFNLLKPIERPKTLWDKVYDWVVGKARVVVLVAELVIAIAFVSKVVVDTQAKNKTKAIERLGTEIQFYSAKEAEFRKVQKKVNDYLKLWDKTSNAAAILTEVYSYIPNPGDEISIKVENDTVSIYGYDSLDSLGSLEAAMKGSDTFVVGSVRIDTLTLEEKEILQETGQYVLSATIIDPTRTDI